ncbi:mRNA-binding ribosome synthesis protein NOC2 [Ascoidea rubescens DSM 1968]|uniref:Noc2-domain-containing protein n=1 Tax=Ascoidea rubescens DSM 1968 TaxID=1344418 RepID=A0A1D2VRL6_9ASCO|nr:Noc2-domain-containing protein [Ascoidea rubescens DSM 1968]ODV64239.1 Noc2-domain-containing protein [Ascoidea rubescens DSM 1968]
MGKTSKSTKKFQSKHLKKTLEHRKKVKKHTQLTAKSNKSKVSREREEYLDTLKGSKNEKGSKVKNDKVLIFDEDDQLIEEDYDNDYDKFNVLSDLKKSDKKNKSLKEEENDDFPNFNNDNESNDNDYSGQLDKDIFAKLEKALQNDETSDHKGQSDGEGEDEESDDEETSKLGINSDFKSEEGENYDLIDSSKTELTAKILKKWFHDLKSSPSVKLFKNIVSAFKSAIYNNEKNDNDKNNEIVFKYAITDPGIFNQLLSLTLKDFPKAVKAFSPINPKTKKPKSQLSKSVFQSLISLISSHISSLIILLNDITLNLNNLNNQFIVLILASVYDFMPFFYKAHKFQSKSKKLITSIKNNMKKVLLTSELNSNALIFSFILNLSKDYPDLLELTINQCYLTFLKKCFQLPISSLESSLQVYKKFQLIEFLKDCLIELFSLDSQFCFTFGYKSIRQLAIHLRNSLKSISSNSNNSNEIDANLRLIYNWQFVQGLSFWSKLLGVYSSKNEKNKALAELNYPLIQVIIGTIKLNSSIEYFPLRFYLLNCMIELSSKTSVYIPIYPLLYEILNSKILNKQIRKTAKDNKMNKSNKLTLKYSLKVPANISESIPYQNYLIEEFISTLVKFFYNYSDNLSFPELSAFIVQSLKAFKKNHGNGSKLSIKLSKSLNQLISKTLENSKFIISKREKIVVSRRNIGNLEKLTDFEKKDTPFSKYYIVQQEINNEEERIIKEGLELEIQEERKNKSGDKKKNFKTLEVESIFGKNSNEDTVMKDFTEHK